MLKIIESIDCDYTNNEADIQDNEKRMFQYIKVKTWKAFGKKYGLDKTQSAGASTSMSPLERLAMK